jgi:putative transposase
VARSTTDYKPLSENPEHIRIKRLLDDIYLIDPCLGSRLLVTVLERDHGVKVNRKRLDWLRREMCYEAIWCKPRTSIPDDGHRKIPYLLRKTAIERSYHVCCADITYDSILRGHAYLCAVMDWHSRNCWDGLFTTPWALTCAWRHRRWRRVPPAGFRRSSIPTRVVSPQEL